MRKIENALHKVILEAFSLSNDLSKMKNYK